MSTTTTSPVSEPALSAPASAPVQVARHGRYEDAQAELNRLFDELNLEGNPQLPHAKRQFRSEKRPYQDVLTKAQASRIGKIFEREIALAGYDY